MECYATGSRNIFVLGFVPLASENTVVLLARDTPASHPAIRELNLDVAQWQPIIEGRSFVNWLVKVWCVGGGEGGGLCEGRVGAWLCVCVGGARMV